MGTFIDGIAASQALDTSGEIVDIKGMDITSLAVSGTINFEHKSDLPAQTVGKILKAVKIFRESDCSNPREKYFWQKCELPFVYIMAELFDDYTASAKEVAGIFKYDEDHRSQHEKNVLSFSIEGAKIPGAIDGMHVKRSIARKCTVTVQPANHTAIAEKVPGTKVESDEFGSIFKAESGFEISMLKSEEVENILKSEEFVSDLNKSATTTASIKIGRTRTGKEITSHGRVADYQNFSSADHKDAHEAHQRQAEFSKDPAMRTHHNQKADLHFQAAHTAEKRELRAKSVGMEVPKVKMSAAQKFAPKLARSEALTKALTAGTPTAPGSNVQGAALQGSEYKPDGSGKALRLEKMKSRIAKKKEKKLAKADDSPASSIGTTRSGKHIMSHADHPAHADYSKADHNDAAAMHAHIGEQMDKEHSNGVLGGTESHSDPLIASRYNHHYEQETAHKKLGTKAKASNPYKGTAKSHRAAQGVQAKKTADVSSRMKKSEMLDRAKYEFEIWPKREAFMAFMKESKPSMTKSEAIAYGQTVALKEAFAAEEALGKLAKVLTFGDGKPAAKVSPENDATPKPVPKEFKDHKKTVKGVEHTEVAHVQPHYDGKSPDTVYTKAGHKLDGHPKGKFKVGDKVTAKSFMMGTHTLEHGHND